MLITSVNSQIDKERQEKIKEREKERRLQLYHSHILNQKLPAVSGDNAASIIIVSSLYGVCHAKQASDKL